MVKDTAGPEQVFEDGWTVKLAMIGMIPALVAEKAGMLPDPVVDANPMPGLACCQV